MPPADFRQSPPAAGATVILPGVDEPVADAPQDSAPDAARYFRRRLESGAPWHRALLEAIGIWTLPEETWQGRRYRYIIGREAFDWLLLAERLCHPRNTQDAAEAIPPRQLERLLFHGILPQPIEPDEFRALLGPTKHQAYLNYHYGITLEEALQLAAEESVRKRHTARGYPDTEELIEQAFRHLYNNTRTSLFQEFTQAANTAPPTPPNQDAPLNSDPANPESNTANPKPDSANPKPDSANPKPDSANPEPDSANPKPDSANPEPPPIYPEPTPIYPELVEGRPGLSLTGLKEFTYWLHKRRVNYWDPARVASDTRLAIRRLAALQETAAPQSTQNIRAD